MVIITSFSVPESAIQLQINNVRVTLDKRDFGSGTLYISERLCCTCYLLYLLLLIFLHYTGPFAGKAVMKSAFPYHTQTSVCMPFAKIPQYAPSIVFMLWSILISICLVHKSKTTKHAVYIEAIHILGCVPEIEDTADNESNDSEPDVSEMLLIPQNPEDVPRIYESLMHCQSLNPDPEDMSEDEDEDHVYQDAENEITEDMGGGGDTGKFFENINETL